MFPIAIGKARIVPLQIGKIWIMTYPEWKDSKLDPADLNKFLPANEDWERFNSPTPSPITNTPIYQSNERIFRFNPGNIIDRDHFYKLLTILGLDSPIKGINSMGKRKRYAVIYQKSKKPEKDRYFSQMRIIDPLDLYYTFGAIEEETIAEFPEQEITCKELLWEFIRQEIKKWGIYPIEGTEQITEKMGGSRNSPFETLRINIMRESAQKKPLCISLMKENDWDQVIRIWSDAYLLRR